MHREVSHIGMFCFGKTGHVLPHLNVIRELVDRGHRVTYAVPAEYADRVAAAGATPVAYTSTLHAEGRDLDPPGLLSAFLDEAVHTLPQLRSAFQGDRPNLVLYDFASYAARVLAEQWGVPSMSLAPTIVVWDGFEEDSRMRSVRRTEAYQAYEERFRDWLAANGLPGRDPYVPRVTAAELGAIPPNAEVHTGVPQPAVLTAADAFITPAGARAATPDSLAIGPSGHLRSHWR
ncbi:hypothetical protein [Streptomyces tsukubensis]|uniref:hypothetical protein n=1 Tax=Streptomyces tsukubensis TaxID=83656 RepID=UPI00344EE0BF